MSRLKPRELALVLYRLTVDLDQDSAAEMIARFTRTLVRKGLGAELPRVLTEYEAVHNRESGIQTVAVESVNALDDQDVAAIIKALGLSKDEVSLKKEVSPELIGGIVARTEDKVIDMSVRRRLADLRGSLSAELAQ